MTSAESLVFYPSYCFHLSPTINKWCPLRATDIVGLESRPGFEVQDVFFHLNYPIRWVRIAGVVVAIDEYYGRRIYTIDDSTGACIECCLAIPKPALAKPQGNTGGEAPSGATKTAAADGTAENPAQICPDVDVGMVVEVRGSITIFRAQKQIKVLKTLHIRSTSQEVQFWNKIRGFREEVLSRPWVLERKQVRRCQKLANAEAGDDRDKRSHREKEKEKKKKTSGGNTGEGAAPEKNQSKRWIANSLGKPAKAECSSSSRAKSADTYVEGQYDALGL